VREGASTLIAEIGEPQVRAYIAYLQQKRKWDDTDHCPTAEQGLFPGGIQNRIRALKAFFAWLHREGYTESYRLEHLANYRIPSRVVDVLSEAEIRRVLGACDRKSDWGARSYAILTLSNLQPAWCRDGAGPGYVKCRADGDPDPDRFAGHV